MGKKKFIKLTFLALALSTVCAVPLSHKTKNANGEKIKVSITAEDYQLHPNQFANLQFEMRNNSKKQIYLLGSAIYAYQFSQKGHELVYNFSFPMGYWKDKTEFIMPYQTINDSPYFVPIMPGRTYKGKINITTPYQEGIYKFVIIYAYNTYKAKAPINSKTYKNWGKEIKATAKIAVR